MKRWSHLVVAIGATCVAGALTTNAHAEVYTTSGREIVQERPNTDLMISGLFTVGLPYIGSVAVAAQSDHPGDNQLYYPVAGPWLDLSQRGSCGTAPGQINCDTETFYKALLIGDGILQGIGALEFVGGLVFPERRVVRVEASSKPYVKVAPGPVGSGMGVGAFGRF